MLIEITGANASRDREGHVIFYKTGNVSNLLTHPKGEKRQICHWSGPRSVSWSEKLGSSSIERENLRRRGDSASRYTAYWESLRAATQPEAYYPVQLAVRDMVRQEEPEIQTERLFLRKLTLQDVPAIHSYRSDPEVMRYQTWHPASAQEIGAFIENINRIGFDVVDTWFQLGIYLRATQVLIGDIGIHFLPPDNRQAEIGFTIAPQYLHKGYATEAVDQLLKYLFKNLGKHRVIASVDPGNSPSIKLLERIGMRKEAHFRYSIWTGKEWADDIVYALLETEWKE
jgi:RimJ/RimL family protein N-acetyltransferase